MTERSKYKLTSIHVDERRDPLVSTHAAARYLRDLYSIFNDWTLVIAAYNCGPGNVNKAIRRAGGKRNYWDIYYYLPRETRGYVPAFIAATYTMAYYKEHNLKPTAMSFPLTVDTLMVSGMLHLQQVSEVLDIPMKTLRDLNPQYNSYHSGYGKTVFVETAFRLCRPLYRQGEGDICL